MKLVHGVIGRLILLACLACVLGGCQSQDLLPSEQGPEWLSRGYEREIRNGEITKKSLGKKIDLELTDVTFENALFRFASVTNINIQADWKQLAAVGVRKDTLVSLSCRQESGRDVLRKIISAGKNARQLVSTNVDELTSLRQLIRGKKVVIMPADGFVEDPLQEVNDIRTAYRILREANVFCTAELGESNMVPASLRAYRLIGKSEHADGVFKDLIENATPTGQLYALCGISDTDAKAFEKRLREFERRDEMVYAQFGHISGKRKISTLARRRVLMADVPLHLGQ